VCAILKIDKNPDLIFNCFPWESLWIGNFYGIIKTSAISKTEKKNTQKIFINLISLCDVRFHHHHHNIVMDNGSLHSLAFFGLVFNIETLSERRIFIH
jgi:hypothetical protein